MTDAILKRPNVPFTQVPNSVLEDDDLSFRAKGLLAYLISRPPGWQFRQSHLAQVSTDGRTSVRSALDELESADYLARDRLRRDDGTLGPYQFTLFPGDDQIPQTDLDQEATRSVSPMQSNRSHSKKETSKHTHGADAPARDDDGVQTPPQWTYYQRVHDVDALPDGMRVETMQIRQWFQQQTGTSIPNTRDHDDALIAIRRTFDEATIKAAIEQVAKPGVARNDRWSYFTNLLNKVAERDDFQLERDNTAGLSDAIKARIEQTQTHQEN
jgi:hypothetical protein